MLCSDDACANRNTTSGTSAGLVWVAALAYRVHVSVRALEEAGQISGTPGSGSRGHVADFEQLVRRHRRQERLRNSLRVQSQLQKRCEERRRTIALRQHYRHQLKMCFELAKSHIHIVRRV